MDALKEIAHALQRLNLLHGVSPLVKLSQVGAGTESCAHLTVNDEGMRIFFESVEGTCEVLQFVKRQRSQFVAGCTVQSKFNDSAFRFPRQRLTPAFLHVDCALY